MDARHKIAIVGFAESYKLAPFNDPDVVIAGLNELYKYLPRWDVWFEIHDARQLGFTRREATDQEIERHRNWLRAQPAGKPIFMHAEFLDGTIPGAVLFPLEHLVRRFFPGATQGPDGRWQGAYFTSTPALMLAWAIDQGYEEIGIYGIDLASDIEYLNQRPCVEYLIGLARGMGRTVIMPPTSALLKAGHIYGFEQPLAETGAVTEKIVRERIRTLKAKRDEYMDLLHTHDGAIAEAQNMLKLMIYSERGVDVSEVVKAHR